MKLPLLSNKLPSTNIPTEESYTFITRITTPIWGETFDFSSEWYLCPSETEVEILLLSVVSQSRVGSPAQWQYP